jgi:tetratricopeptide (TPR) repeat protein
MSATVHIHMNNTSDNEMSLLVPNTDSGLSERVSALALSSIPSETQNLLLRMFADPYLLEKEDRGSLVEQLRECVAQYPHVSELRVLLGMALCVSLDAQAAIGQLEESVRLAPNSFIAQLKLGELWMRLRAMQKAEEHTRLAGLLAQSLAQSELARRQAATIRTMRREGIERGGYKSPWSWIARPLRRLWTRNRSEPSVALDIS